MLILVATDREVVVIDAERGLLAPAYGIGERPTCVSADPRVHGRAWCGTHRDGVFRSDDGGRSWQSVGLRGRLIMAVTASPADRDVVWVGTEPSEVWRSEDAGNTWLQTSRLRHCPRRPNGPFRRGQILITFAGLRVTRSNRSDFGSRSKPERSSPRLTAVAHGATACPVDHGIPTSSPFTTRLPIHYASPLAMDISRVTMPVRRGARPRLASRSVTCGAWRSIRSNRRSSWYQRRRARTPRT